MMSSGLKVPIPAIPMPAFAVPYAAPIELNTIAAQIPAKPKNGAYAGHTLEPGGAGTVGGGNGEDIFQKLCT